MERSWIAVEDDARAAGEPECQPRSQLEWSIAASHLGEVLSSKLELYDLTKPALVIAFEHDVATDLQLQFVQRRLELEAPPVDRGRERQNRLFELPPHRPELGGLFIEARAHSRRSRVSILRTVRRY